MLDKYGKKTSKKVDKKQTTKNTKEKQTAKKPTNKIKIELPKEVKEKPLRTEIEESFQKSDFKDFSAKKMEHMSFPEIKLNKDFMSTYNLEEFDHVPQKSIPEQIKSLSPELKALIVAGVLDKKDIDNI